MHAEMNYTYTNFNAFQITSLGVLGILSIGNYFVFILHSADLICNTTLLLIMQIK